MTKAFFNRKVWMSVAVAMAAAGVLWLSAAAEADYSFHAVAAKVNPKVVKVFGAGGYRGVTAYCTGVLVSPDGYILTVYSPTLDSRELRVHLYDGTRHLCELVAAEPQLEAALIRIKDRERFQDLPLDYFDLNRLPPEPKVGDWVLAFSNQFEIATRDEPVSLQRGVIAAIAPLAGRRGVHRARYQGRAYILDAVTNNPGAHGGIITTRTGELLGLIGKELTNTLTETRINYAIPIRELVDFVTRARKGDYKQKPTDRDTKIADKGGFHGIVLVPDILDRTPPYVEEVLPGSPADQAGLRPDDLIVFIHTPIPGAGGEWQEHVIASVRIFRETMAQVEPGTTIKVIVRRDQQLLAFDLTVTAAETRPR